MVQLQVRHWLMFLLYNLKRIGHKIFHLTLIVITVSMLMISLFCLLHQNIQKPSEMVDILTCHIQLKTKSKAERPFLMHRLFMKLKHLPFQSTVNLPLVEFIKILHFDSFLPFTYEFGTVYTLTYRYFRICSSQTVLHTELVCLKQFFLQKWLPWKFYVSKDLLITYSL